MIVRYVNLKKRIVSTKIDYNNELSDILRNVSEFTGISEDLIKSKNRKNEVADARHIYMSYAYNSLKKKKYSNARIAKYIYKDHASCNYAKKRCLNEYDLKTEYNNFIEYMNELKTVADN